MKLPTISKLFATRQASIISVTSITLVVGILVATVAWIMQLVYYPGSAGDSRVKAAPDLTMNPYGLSASNTVLASAGDLADGVDTPLSYTPTPDSLSPLSGRRIGLDPGHGPRDDLGAVLVDTTTGAVVLSEAEFNLDVALRCRDILVARGASVVLTRESADTFTTPWPADLNGDGVAGETADDLQARIDILNDFGAEVFLSIHANGGVWQAGAGRDIQVIYCGTSDCPFPGESKRLGQIVLDELRDGLTSATDSWQGGGALFTDLEVDSSDPPQHMFILGPSNQPRHPRSTGMPGVLAESLYVTSAVHAAQLNKDSVRQAIALAYADALQYYLLDNGSRQP